MTPTIRLGSTSRRRPLLVDSQYELFYRPTRNTSSFWGCVYAISQGVRLLDVTYTRPDLGRHHYRLDNKDNQAEMALQRWFTEATVVNVRDMINAYYQLSNAIRQAKNHAASAELARGA